MGRRSALRLLAAAVVGAAGLVVPTSVAAHPLGNFTINHFAELTIASDRIDLDVVIDMAEIPAFQERQAMDVDGDGSVAEDEAATWAVGACRTLAASLRLTVGATVPALTDGPASATFPPGAGGLSTLRLSCSYGAALPVTIDRRTVVTFADGSDPGRIGWREIVATASGTILDTHGLPATSPSAQLTAYPANRIATPLDIRSATIDVRPDPAAIAPAIAASGATGTAPPPAAGAPVASGPGVGSAAQAATGAVTATGAVPGGVAADLPDIFRTADLTPFVILASFVTALVIGAGHALTPGHGKTLMAASLVGSRGSAVHAVGLGLSVALSHTFGILALALVVVGAGSVLPPDLVYRITPVIAGASIVAIGGWMLAGELGRRPRRPASADLGRRADGPPAPVHEDEHDLGARHDHAPGRPGTGEHGHGGVRHRHVRPTGATLSWRGLFVLGLAGGLIPSTSALLILLGSIAAGRPAFGLLLVMAFGLGMAAVMTGVGLAMIFARTRLDRMPSRSSLGRVARVAPLVASVAVLTLGLVLTWQAVAGTPVL